MVSVMLGSMGERVVDLLAGEFSKCLVMGVDVCVSCDCVFFEVEKFGVSLIAVLMGDRLLVEVVWSDWDGLPDSALSPLFHKRVFCVYLSDPELFVGVREVCGFFNGKCDDAFRSSSC